MISSLELTASQVASVYKQGIVMDPVVPAGNNVCVIYQELLFLEGSHNLRMDADSISM